jgi:succinate dehydrogenase / fumarate reductase cytochrome b subunit
LAWLAAALNSTVGRKFVMGLTGLFLCFFLVVHLSGNVLLYVGPETYNDYAHKLHGVFGEFLLISQVLLYLAFALHIWMAISLTVTNTSARSTGYAMKQTKVEGRALNMFGWTPDNTMVVTGLVVLLFLAVHLGDFKFETWWGEEFEEMEPFAKAVVILAEPSRWIIYGVGSAVLGVHVAHGLASAFQSLGLNHPKYTPTIKTASLIFGIVVAIGFGTLPILFKAIEAYRTSGP